MMHLFPKRAVADPTKETPSVPNIAKVQMAIETVTVKAKEPTSGFEAFIYIAAGFYYCLEHYPKATVSTVLGGGGVTAAIYYLIQHYVLQ